MKYQFERGANRRGTNAVKWDCAEGELPMWIGDMDFETPPEIIRAVEERAKSGAYGYTFVGDEWYEAIGHWWRTRYDFQIEKDWLIFSTGVIPAISCLVKRFTNIGDNVVVITPVYSIFFNSILNGGRHALECPFDYRDGEYSLDLNKLEEKLALPTTTLLLFCNPHNPVGKIWTKEELAKIGELCEKHGVTVISDEVHCDIVETGFRYTPFASASETCKQISITCIAANKTFNLAGLQGAAVFVPEKRKREIAVRGLNSDEVAEPNCFACVATTAAYRYGGEWCDEMREVVTQNKRYAEKFISEQIPSMRPIVGQSTYFLWVDCSRLCEDSSLLCEEIRKRSGLILSSGGAFRGNGKTFVRINLACPFPMVKEGMDRLKRATEEIFGG